MSIWSFSSYQIQYVIKARLDFLFLHNTTVLGRTAEWTLFIQENFNFDICRHFFV